MFKRILVPLDESTRAQQAIPIAARIARATGGAIVLLRVVTSSIDLAWYSMESPVMLEQAIDDDLARAKKYVTTVAASSELAGIKTITEVLPGEPATTIFAAARAHSADLIVMCSHGNTGVKRWILGSVSQKVARHSPIPVLILREGTGMPVQKAHPVRIMVTLDGSSLAEAALTPAAYLCSALSAPAQGMLHLALVLRRTEAQSSDQGDKAMKNAQAYLLLIEQRLSEGDMAALNLQVTASAAIDEDVAESLIRVAETGEGMGEVEGFEGCSGIAMATHGRGGPQRWMMGSITERVLETTKLPLLIVRPQRVEAKSEKTGAVETETQSFIGLL